MQGGERQRKTKHSHEKCMRECAKWKYVQPVTGELQLYRLCRRNPRGGMCSDVFGHISLSKVIFLIHLNQLYTFLLATWGQKHDMNTKLTQSTLFPLLHVDMGNRFILTDPADVDQQKPSPDGCQSNSHSLFAPCLVSTGP